MKHKYQATITNFKKVCSLMNRIIEMAESDEYGINLLSQSRAIQIKTNRDVWR